VVRDRKAAVLITDAAEDPEKELRRREIRYVVTMLIRALCLIAGAVLVSTKPPLWGVWLVLCIVGMVVLPWLAVIRANDRPARRRGQPERPDTAQRPALPSVGEERIIEGR
jgi:hypothetical protein